MANGDDLLNFSPEDEKHTGSASMQSAASNNLIFIGPSSFKRSADFEKTSHAGLYQAITLTLIRACNTNQTVASTLGGIADFAYAIRDFDVLAYVGQLLMNQPHPCQLTNVGRYYQALSLNRATHGDTVRASSVFEQIADDAPLRYRARAMLALGANSLAAGDEQTALSLYRDAMRMGTHAEAFDSVTLCIANRMTAVIKAMEGDHRRALADLEKMFPLARMASSVQPYTYYDYLNTLAVELTEAGRLEEARNASRIALASPLALAYPEWRETSEEIELKGRRASHSTVAVGTPKIAGWSSEVSKQEAVGRRQKAEGREQKADARGHRPANVVALSTARLDPPAITPRQEAASTTRRPRTRARVIKFPSLAPCAQRELSEKQMIVADKLWNMFQATIHDAPLNLGLIERLYKVFLNEQKPA